MIYCLMESDPDGFAFAIIESRMFMAWQKGIGGRLKSACNFSNTVVWNNLPLPEITDDMRAQIIAAGQRILDVRKQHSGQSLADLYDPYVMPLDLRKAHEDLDKLVDRAFGAPRWFGSDDDARLQLLFADYARLTRTKERR
ncbi:DNA methyloase, restriction enzyme [Bifidobacterium criceti]|uniref:DNA methyloase, restriction enzyme n=2 Tax=Bifidobacterium criceti TaxID=1960969 RepID=A0A2A2EJ63_9BIFI|nr:DNA methyloase, restriction enzyme [Bifidobacterium criceti]